MVTRITSTTFDPNGSVSLNPVNSIKSAIIGFEVEINARIQLEFIKIQLKSIKPAINLGNPIDKYQGPRDRQPRWKSRLGDL